MQEDENAPPLCNGSTFSEEKHFICTKPMEHKDGDGLKRIFAHRCPCHSYYLVP